MKQRVCYLSLARVICAVAVVMIHTNGCFYEFNIEQCWPLANVIESGLGFAVPVFMSTDKALVCDLYMSLYMRTLLNIKLFSIIVFVSFLIILIKKI